MSHKILLTLVTWCAVALLFLSSSTFCLPASAQSTEDIAAMKQTVSVLVKQTKYTEALPLLEKIVVAEPGNAYMHFYLGFALIAEGLNTKAAAPRAALRVRARAEFVRAKELNIAEPVVDAMINGIAPDGADPGVFSQNIIANSLMTEAEGYFGQGKLDEALADYKKALELIRSCTTPRYSQVMYLYKRETSLRDWPGMSAPSRLIQTLRRLIATQQRL